jgi:hypothetical protein
MKIYIFKVFAYFHSLLFMSHLLKAVMNDKKNEWWFGKIYRCKQHNIIKFYIIVCFILAAGILNIFFDSFYFDCLI